MALACTPQHVVQNQLICRKASRVVPRPSGTSLTNSPVWVPPLRLRKIVRNLVVVIVTDDPTGARPISAAQSIRSFSGIDRQRTEFYVSASENGRVPSWRCLAQRRQALGLAEGSVH